MKRVSLIAIVACIGGAGFCGPKGDQESFIPSVWKEEGIVKVVGYRFKIPGENDRGELEDGFFSLCRDSSIDLKKLEELQAAKAELSDEQVAVLLECVFGDHEALPHVACYSPHQIFVFYDMSGTAKRVIEVCFSCNGITTIPTLPEERARKHDLLKLARLCGDLGIWSEETTPEDYVPPFTERKVVE